MNFLFRQLNMTEELELKNNLKGKLDQKIAIATT